MIFSTFILAIAASQGSIKSLTSCLSTTGIRDEDGQGYFAMECFTNLYSNSDCQSDFTPDLSSGINDLALKNDNMSLLPAAVAQGIECRRLEQQTIHWSLVIRLDGNADSLLPYYKKSAAEAAEEANEWVAFSSANSQPWKITNIAMQRETIELPFITTKVKYRPTASAIAATREARVVTYLEPELVSSTAETLRIKASPSQFADGVDAFTATKTSDRWVEDYPTSRPAFATHIMLHPNHIKGLVPTKVY